LVKVLIWQQKAKLQLQVLFYYAKKGIEKQKADTDIISYSYFNGSLLFLYVLIVSLYESLAKKTMSTQFVSLCYRKPSNNYTMCLQNVKQIIFE